VTSARPDREIVVATQECAGACVDWLARLLALDHGALDVLAAGAEPGGQARCCSCPGWRASVSRSTIRWRAAAS
jgi:hypothetical protein